MLHRAWIVLRIGLAGLACCPGCARWQHQTVHPRTLLKPATASDDSVTLEIFFARLPSGRKVETKLLWATVDEQQLSSEVRRQLAINGFRAGISGGQIPTELAELLHLTDEPRTESLNGQVPSAHLEGEPLVRRRLLQLRSGRRGDILASGIYDSLSLLVRRGGQVSGATFKKAQGLFAVHSAFDGNGQIRLALTPELHYGDARQQWTGRDGIFRLEMSRPKEVYEDLTMEVLLSPGQLLIVTCPSGREGSLGHHFFTDTTGEGKQQKVLVIRLSDMPADPLKTSSDRAAAR